MMKYIQQDYLKISHFTTTEWQHPVHNHNHFEIIYIHKGKGQHFISEASFSYEDNSVFLLAPCDHHRFEISEDTTFTFIKFTDVYPLHVGNIQPGEKIAHDIDLLLFHAGRNRKQISLADNDRYKLRSLVGLINEEWQETKNSTSQLIYSLMQSVFLILKRNLPETAGTEPNGRASRFSALANYIHQHIYEPEEIHSDKLATRFNLSTNYLGAFVKRETGKSLREYIREYKIGLIKNRLQYSAHSIKTISIELGFTDLSHFNKYVKKLTGKTPSAYRAETDSDS
ncbi:helix-turn-helix transcriptional regulator [Pedobacter sp. SYP-B3415]|uniref:helix-turn-helix transcriptional regulator n=1 Tax=Pedobacter sp. SYP-B3415 TaxID=2496641 RepID=UPI00101C1BCD|nr:helix-turn-helix transcriptional regulator [Pedobacter sp. SYP-B3415]